MAPRDLCQSYLSALNAADLDTVLSLFTDDARVHSPLYGARDVRSFYTELFSDTKRSETRLLNIFDTSDTSTSIALHFQYNWTLANASLVTFECVDIFELSPSGNQFTRITIIYDTAPLRHDFEASRSEAISK